MAPGHRGKDRVDPRTAAEKAFKSFTTKPAEPAPKQPAVPGRREQVTLRIDSAVLERFQSEGPGWQDRINDVLRKAVGLDTRSNDGLPVEKLNAENDG